MRIRPTIAYVNLNKNTSKVKIVNGIDQFKQFKMAASLNNSQFFNIVFLIK